MQKYEIQNTRFTSATCLIHHRAQSPPTDCCSAFFKPLRVSCRCNWCCAPFRAMSTHRHTHARNMHAHSHTHTDTHARNMHAHTHTHTQTNTERQTDTVMRDMASSADIFWVKVHSWITPITKTNLSGQGEHLIMTTLTAEIKPENQHANVAHYTLLEWKRGFFGSYWLFILFLMIQTQTRKHTYTDTNTNTPTQTQT